MRRSCRSWRSMGIPYITSRDTSSSAWSRAPTWNTWTSGRSRLRCARQGAAKTSRRLRTAMGKRVRMGIWARRYLQTSKLPTTCYSSNSRLEGWAEPEVVEHLTIYRLRGFWRWYLKNGKMRWRELRILDLMATKEGRNQGMNAWFNLATQRLKVTPCFLSTETLLRS